MYLNGFNDFGQLKNCLCSKEQATCTCTRITALYVDNINTQQSIHKDLLKSTNIRFIWTNMFFVDDKEALKVQGLNAGFKGEFLSQNLKKRKIKVKCLVSAGSNNVVIQDHDGSLWFYHEGDKELRYLESSQDDLTLTSATEKLLVAINGQREVYTSELCSDLKLTFSQPLTDLSVSSVSCGLEHVVLLSDTGQVYSYGSSSRGQLGHGELTVDKVTRPTPIDSFEGINVTSVGCGGWHSTAVTSDGDMYVWGWNESGQLGLPNGKEADASKDVSASESARTDCSEEICRKRPRMCSDSDVCALCKEAFDIPHKIIQNIEPVQVQIIPFGLDLPDDLKVKKTSCGTRHTCALFEPGVLMTCGWNNYGQLCHGDTENRDFLQTVQYFVDKHETVVDVKAECWNTAVRVRNKR